MEQSAGMDSLSAPPPNPRFRNDSERISPYTMKSLKDVLLQVVVFFAVSLLVFMLIEFYQYRTIGPEIFPPWHAVLILALTGLILGCRGIRQVRSNTGRIRNRDRRDDQTG